MTSAPVATFAIPAPVSALAFGQDGVLYVGSDDGTVRWYSLPSTRVARAIKSLGDEISSIAVQETKKEESNVVWSASGRWVFAFSADTTKLLLTKDDAMQFLEIGEDEEDVLNELNISNNGKAMAFCTDSGTVGVVDLLSLKITRMKNRHSTICGSVKFIPDRPNELISGGFDSAVLHFDIGQGTVLSRFDITTAQPSEGISLSPPFVLSMSISANSLAAISTADGRLWLGGGGEKRPGAKKKRSRKWEGLKDNEGTWMQVAEGPVVATVFIENNRLFTCSLLGEISGWVVSRSVEDSLQVESCWKASTQSAVKINAMVASEERIAVGGFSQDGKGLVELWAFTSESV